MWLGPTAPPMRLALGNQRNERRNLSVEYQGPRPTSIQSLLATSQKHNPIPVQLLCPQVGTQNLTHLSSSLHTHS